LVERHQRDDWKGRYVAHRVDRVIELTQVRERLDEEHVSSAALEDRRLLGVDLAPDPRRRRLAERADRSGDEHVLARDLAGVAGELHRGRVDVLEVVLEVMVRELAAVRAERVRLDELGARSYETDVERDHGLGG